MNTDEARLSRNCRIILEISCRVKAGETVLILMIQLDRQEHLSYLRSLSRACVEMGAHPVILDIEEYRQSPAFKEGHVNKVIKSAMESADVLIGFNTRSFDFFSRLVGETGGGRSDKYLIGERRWMELQCDGMDKWDITSEQIAAIPRRTMWLLDLIKNARTGRITSSLGTDFSFGLGAGSNAKPILGIVPLYGEVAVAPRPGSEEGVIVVGGPTQKQVRPRTELDREPLRIVIEKGKMRDAGGDSAQVRRLKDFIASGDPRADRVDEVGLVTTQVVENDLYWWYDGTHHHNTTHVALGNNMDKEHKVHGQRHMDGEIVNPTITIDNVVITKDGVFMDNIIC